MERNDERQLQHRYMQVEVMAELTLPAAVPARPDAGGGTARWNAAPARNNLTMPSIASDGFRPRKL